MKVSRWTGLLALAWQTSAAASIRNYETHDYFALHLEPSASPLNVAQALGASLEGPLGELDNHYIYSAPKDASLLVEDTLHEVRRRRRRKREPENILSESTVLARQVAQLEGVLWSEKQQLRQRLVKRIPPPSREVRQGDPAVNVPPDDEEHKAAAEQLDLIATTLDIHDPIFKEQWHLFNPVQLGHDLNVTGVWLQGITGNGSITSVIDDGLDMYSDDLKDNYFAPGSHDFNDPGDEPRPRLFDDKHGTRCAGEIAAVKNNVCGVGIAYDGKISGVRILSKAITDEDEALAIIYDYQENQIYSCSWGPPDDGMTMEAPGILIQRAMLTGVQKGRQGHGSVYVFAAGNGALSGDNCNFDGYTNSIYSVTVGGIDREGNHPYYSEMCSAQLVVTYSSGAGDAIHTTDVGVDKCSTGHGGTSAAGPLVAGTIALALGLRPELTWRDVQYLCIEAAIPIHLDDSEWQDTFIGKKFSHTFGYGKMDAWRFVEAATTFESVKPQAWYHSPWLTVQNEIPQGDQGLASSFDVTNDMLKKANLERLEHVTITMNVNHTRRGDLSVELRSPEGIISHIATARTNDAFKGGYEDWTFMSVAHWSVSTSSLIGVLTVIRGESGLGTWTIIVKDSHVNEMKGRFLDWRLNLWGECIDASIQELHPLPDEHDDDHEVADVPVHTTSITPTPPQTDLPATPSDHIDRPVNAKPSNAASETIPTSTIPTSLTTSTPTIVPTPTHTPSESFLPSFFPTFGVSKRTQTWIYGSFGLIVVFCCALGVYFYVQRKKRLRNNPRDDYEFEVLDDHDDDTSGMNGNAGGRKAKRRAGELYDAFAGESDEEVFSDVEDEPYKDTPHHGKKLDQAGAPQVDS